MLRKDIATNILQDAEGDRRIPLSAYKEPLQAWVRNMDGVFVDIETTEGKSPRISLLPHTERVMDHIRAKLQLTLWATDHWETDLPSSTSILRVSPDFESIHRTVFDDGDALWSARNNKDAPPWAAFYEAAMMAVAEEFKEWPGGSVNVLVKGCTGKNDWNRRIGLDRSNNAYTVCDFDGRPVGDCLYTIDPDKADMPLSGRDMARGTQRFIEATEKRGAPLDEGWFVMDLSKRDTSRTDLWGLDSESKVGNAIAYLEQVHGCVLNVRPEGYLVHLEGLEQAREAVERADEGDDTEEDGTMDSKIHRMGTDFANRSGDGLALIDDGMSKIQRGKNLVDEGKADVEKGWELLRDA